MVSLMKHKFHTASRRACRLFFFVSRYLSLYICHGSDTVSFSLSHSSATDYSKDFSRTMVSTVSIAMSPVRSSQLQEVP